MLIWVQWDWEGNRHLQKTLEWGEHWLRNSFWEEQKRSKFDSFSRFWLWPKWRFHLHLEWALSCFYMRQLCLCDLACECFGWRRPSQLSALIVHTLNSCPHFHCPCNDYYSHWSFDWINYLHHRFNFLLNHSSYPHLLSSLATNLCLILLSSISVLLDLATSIFHLVWAYGTHLHEVKTIWVNSCQWFPFSWFPRTLETCCDRLDL